MQPINYLAVVFLKMLMNYCFHPLGLNSQSISFLSKKHSFLDKNI